MPNREIKDERSEETEKPAAAPVQLNPLVIKLPDDKEKELVAIIMEDYRNAKLARQETTWGMSSEGEAIDFDTKQGDLIKLYEGESIKRPEAWMCGRSLKIAQAIVELMVAKLYPAVMNEDTIRWKPVEWSDKQRTERVNKIMRWVLLVWMKVRKDVLQYVRICSSMGTVVAETYWKTKKRDTGKTESVPVMDEQQQPMMDPASGQPMSIETKLLQVDEHPAIRFIPISKFFIQPGQTDIQEEPVIKEESFFYSELLKFEKEGVMYNVTDKVKESVDKSLDDKMMQELEKAEKIADINAKRRAKPVEAITWYGCYDIDDDGFEEEVMATAATADEILIKLVKTASVVRKGTRPLFKSNYLDRIHKFYGIGLLEQVKPLAEEIDACFRQLQDANTLSIMRWGFYDPNSDYDPSEHVAKPRAMYPVSNPSANVYFPDMNIQIERLLNAIKLVMEFIERLTAASSYMMGKESEIVGGSGTATRTQAIMSSAETRFNLPATNMREGLAEIFTSIFDLCFLNMPPGLEKRIVGEDGEPIFDSAEAVKDAFINEMDCYLLPSGDMGDPNMARQLAVLLYDKFVLGGNPLVVSDMGRVWHATANVLSAYGEEPVEWIGEPASKKSTNDPEKEMTLMREGHVIHAEPQENHLEHIMVHSRLDKSPDVLLWPPEAVQMNRAHIQEHMQMMKMVLQFQQNQKKGGGLDNQQGKPTDSGSGPGGAPGEQGVSGTPQQSGGTPEKQTAGTTAGTPVVQ